MGLEDQLSTVNDAYLNEKMAAYRSAGADARKKTEIVDNVANVFQNTFSNVFEMTESASNDYKAAAFYNSRTADFKGLQQAVATRTDGVSE